MSEVPSFMPPPEPARFQPFDQHHQRGPGESKQATPDWSQAHRAQHDQLGQSQKEPQKGQEFGRSHDGPFNHSGHQLIQHDQTRFKSEDFGRNVPQQRDQQRDKFQQQEQHQQQHHQEQHHQQQHHQQQQHSFGPSSRTSSTVTSPTYGRPRGREPSWMVIDDDSVFLDTDSNLGKTQDGTPSSSQFGKGLHDDRKTVQGGWSEVLSQDDKKATPAQSSMQQPPPWSKVGTKHEFGTSYNQARPAGPVKGVSELNSKPSSQVSTSPYTVPSRSISVDSAPRSIPIEIRTSKPLPFKPGKATSESDTFDFRPHVESGFPSWDASQADSGSGAQFGAGSYSTLPVKRSARMDDKTDARDSEGHFDFNIYSTLPTIKPLRSKKSVEFADLPTRYPRGKLSTPDLSRPTPPATSSDFLHSPAKPKSALCKITDSSVPIMSTDSPKQSRKDSDFSISEFSVEPKSPLRKDSDFSLTDFSGIQSPPVKSECSPFDGSQVKPGKDYSQPLWTSTDMTGAKGSRDDRSTSSSNFTSSDSRDTVVSMDFSDDQKGILRDEIRKPEVKEMLIPVKVIHEEAGVTKAGNWNHEQVGISKAGGLSKEDTGLTKAGGWNHEQAGVSKAGGLSKEHAGLNKAGNWSHEQAGVSKAGDWNHEQVGLSKAGGLSKEDGGLGKAGGWSPLKGGPTKGSVECTSTAAWCSVSSRRCMRCCQ